jgi:hypothetical protein
MTAPNIEIGKLTKVLGDSNPDGVSFNAPAAVRSNPMQGMIQGTGVGTLINFQANMATLAAVGANTCANSANAVVNGLLTTDFVLGVSKPTANTGLGVCGWRCSAANTIDVDFCNPTAGSLTPTAAESYMVTALRGLNTLTQTITVPAVLANGTTEQTYTFAGTGATATATINAAGQITGITLVAGGSGYIVPPTVVITPVVGQGGPGAGSGATAVTTVSSGQVTGISITNPGQGYTVAPLISFIGGNAFAPGMIAAVNPGAYTANLGVGNVRVAGNNQIAIEWINTGGTNIATANVSYQIAAFNELVAASPITTISATLSGLTAVTANNSTQTAIALPGSANIIAMQDFAISVNSNVGFVANLAAPWGQVTANSVAINFSCAGLNTGTPGAGIYSVSLLRSNMAAPMTVNDIFITPTSVAAINTAEQTFTLPSNFTLPAANICTVLVNKLSYTPGIAIVGARAVSTTSIGITFYNGTNTAIVPPAEWYRVAAFVSPVPTVGAGNVTSGACYQPVSIAMNQVVDLQNELQQSLQAAGTIKGA